MTGPLVTCCIVNYLGSSKVTPFPYSNTNKVYWRLCYLFKHSMIRPWVGRQLAIKPHKYYVILVAGCMYI